MLGEIEIYCTARVAVSRKNVITLYGEMRLQGSRSIVFDFP